jgi:hypothetical protein
MKKKLIVLLLTFCCTFPVFGMEIENMDDRNQLQLEAHVNINDRVLGLIGIMVFCLMGLTGYNMYQARKSKNELESKEAELKAVQNELQESQIELVKILVNKEAELYAKDKELKKSQEKLVEQQQILFNECAHLRSKIDKLLVRIALLEMQQEDLVKQCDECRGLEDRIVGLQNMVVALERENRRLFADKMYAKWKERTRFALVEYGVVGEQNNFDGQQRDYQIQ